MIDARREETLYRLPAPRGARAAVGWRMAAMLVLGAADGGWLASSFVAWRLGYAARLGRAWLVRPSYPDRWFIASFVLLAAAIAGMALFAGTRRGAMLLAPLAVPVMLAGLGPLYSPVRMISWIHAYGRLPRLDRLVTAGEAIGAGAMLACFSLTAAYARSSLGRLQRVGDLHGSSHWASVREAAAAGLLEDGEGGIVVGSLGKHLLVDRKDRHALVYAPSGTGKSTCLVIPTLLRWPASLLAFDIKGELWEKTAGYRQSTGQVAIRFDPTLKRGSASYNPLLAIPRSEEDVAYAQDVADILVNPEGKETTGGERFFEDSARALLTGVILHAVYSGPRPSLGACLQVLSSPEPAKTWEAMR